MKLYKGDCLEVMKEIEAGSIDAQLDFENWQDDLDITLINTKNDTDDY